MPSYISSSTPTDSQCTFRQGVNEDCSAIVSSNGGHPHPTKPTLYISIESPLSRLHNDSMFTYTATPKTNAAREANPRED
jgi:hypothetical protein